MDRLRAFAKKHGVVIAAATAFATVVAPTTTSLVTAVLDAVLTVEGASQ